jgi:hypothetical protein
MNYNGGFNIARIGKNGKNTPDDDYKPYFYQLVQSLTVWVILQSIIAVSYLAKLLFIPLFSPKDRRFQPCLKLLYLKGIVHLPVKS